MRIRKPVQCRRIRRIKIRRRRIRRRHESSTRAFPEINAELQKHYIYS